MYRKQANETSKKLHIRCFNRRYIIWITLTHHFGTWRMMSRWGLQNKSKLVTSGLLRIGLYTIYYFTVGYDLFDFSHAEIRGFSTIFRRWIPSSSNPWKLCWTNSMLGGKPICCKLPSILGWPVAKLKGGGGGSKVKHVSWYVRAPSVCMCSAV